MEAQLEYSRLLHGSGYGIALRKPSHDINVGDLCYWSPDGKASRILNVFDNKQVFSSSATCAIQYLMLISIVAPTERLASFKHFKSGCD